MTTQLQALSRAAAAFRDYEAHHRAEADKFDIGSISTQGSAAELTIAAQQKASRSQKAKRNRELAEMCEEAGGRTGSNFQDRVHIHFMLPCFGAEILMDITERFDRLIEEVLEAAQTQGYDFGRVARLVKYVGARQVGEVGQEFGGVMVCAAAAATACDVNLGVEAETELDRIVQPETMRKIRAKQAAKPSMSPAPQ